MVLKNVDLAGILPPLFLLSQILKPNSLGTVPYAPAPRDPPSSRAWEEGRGEGLLCGSGAAGPLALVRVEQTLAQPDRFWGDLYKLVIGNIGDRLLEAHKLRRRQSHSLVLRSRADVSQLLALKRVDVEVVAAS